MRKIAITLTLVTVLAAPASFAATTKAAPSSPQNQIARSVKRFVKRFFTIGILGEITIPIPAPTTSTTVSTTTTP